MINRSVDNFDAITEMAIDPHYEPDMFYYVQILKREKDGHKHLGDGNSKRLVKSYVIKEMKQLAELKEEIVTLCNMFNARAYIYPGCKYFHEVSLQMLIDLADDLIQKNYSKLNHLWDSACGKSKGESIWVVDLDNIDTDSEQVQVIKDYINSLEPHVDWDKTSLVLPTVHGCHLLTTSFNLQKFHERYHDIDVHKNNPTLLYYRLKNNEQTGGDNF